MELNEALRGRCWNRLLVGDVDLGKRRRLWEEGRTQGGGEVGGVGAMPAWHTRLA